MCVFLLVTPLILQLGKPTQRLRDLLNVPPPLSKELIHSSFH